MPLPDGFLKQFQRPVFIETGTHRGDGVQAAVEAGFERIYSADISLFNYGWCCHRFHDNRGLVDLYWGDSRDLLVQLLVSTQSVMSWSVFWLDAHWCGETGELEGRGYKDEYAAPIDAHGPLLDELKIIGQHPVKTHTILIDDVRMMGTEHFPDSLEDVLQALRTINPEYRIEYADSRDFKDDILIARFH